MTWDQTICRERWRWLVQLQRWSINQWWATFKREKSLCEKIMVIDIFEKLEYIHLQLPGHMGTQKGWWEDSALQSWPDNIASSRGGMGCFTSRKSALPHQNASSEGGIVRKAGASQVDSRKHHLHLWVLGHTPGNHWFMRWDYQVTVDKKKNRTSHE